MGALATNATVATHAQAGAEHSKGGGYDNNNFLSSTLCTFQSAQLHKSEDVQHMRVKHVTRSLALACLFNHTHAEVIVRYR